MNNQSDNLTHRSLAASCFNKTWEYLRKRELREKGTVAFFQFPRNRGLKTPAPNALPQSEPPCPLTTSNSGWPNFQIRPIT